MLNAIIHGKKRGTGLEGVRLKLGEAEGAEDVLTATVFERLSYLPDDVLQKVFAYLLHDELGALDEIEFWPFWSFSGAGVEPDAVLTFDTCHVLVEAKRHDFSQQQYADQLARELLAGWTIDQLEGPVVLLTVGGLDEYSPDQERSLKGRITEILNNHTVATTATFELACRSWRDVYQALDQAVQDSLDHGKGLQRLVDDIGNAFAWHGIRTHPIRWLSGLSGCDIVSDSFCRLRDLAVEADARSVLTPLATLAPVQIDSVGTSFDSWRLVR
jgi:hypothetical protein